MSELNVYHHELRPDEYDEFYLKYEADKVIAEKDNEIRRMKRALWLARSERARDKAKMFWNRWEDVNFRKWQKVKRKCLKKAEEYK